MKDHNKLIIFGIAQLLAAIGLCLYGTYIKSLLMFIPIILLGLTGSYCCNKAIEMKWGR